LNCLHKKDFFLSEISCLKSLTSTIFSGQDETTKSADQMIIMPKKVEFKDNVYILDAGIITEDEFQDKKKDLMGKV
jgi:hypothetical protein